MNITDSSKNVPPGYCHCGCGEKTAIATRNFRSQGIKAGEPLRFVRGHNKIKPRPAPYVDETNPSICRIPLTGGREAIADAADLHLIGPHAWYAHGSGRHWYASRQKGRQTIRLHNVISPPPPGLVVDHINGDTLDNRRCNLRHVTFHGNTMSQRRPAGNTSGYKGVARHKASEKWAAYIRVEHKRIHLGLFSDIVEAAMAYDNAAVAAFGDLAVTNFPNTKGQVNDR